MRKRNSAVLKEQTSRRAGSCVYSRNELLAEKATTLRQSAIRVQFFIVSRILNTISERDTFHGLRNTQRCATLDFSKRYILLNGKLINHSVSIFKFTRLRQKSPLAEENVLRESGILSQAFETKTYGTKGTNMCSLHLGRNTTYTIVI